MRAKIIAIGNSKGLRLPKAVLHQYGFQGEVELVLQEEGLLIKPTDAARAGWDEAFARMHEQGDDAPLIDEGLDLDEWGADDLSSKAR